MKTAVVAQGKGGVGKTATAAHIAWYGVESGLRVLAIDLDTGNLSKSLTAAACGIAASQLFSPSEVIGLAAKPADGPRLDLIVADRLLANLIYMPLDQARENLSSQLAKLSDAYDLCVIDTAPGLSIALGSALHAADAVIAPVEMEVYSIEGIKDMLGIILMAKEINPDLQFLGILPSRVDLRNPRQVQILAQVQEAHGNLLTPFKVGLRSSVADALALGQPVWKSRKTSARAAATEMRQMGAYILNKLGLINENLGDAQ